MFYFVVPCGGRKADHAAPAGALYTGSLFTHVFHAAVGEAAATERDLGTPARVLILSAKYGLVTPEQILAPYDVKMGDADAVTPEELAAQAAAHGIGYGDEVFAMLPAAYYAVLRAALDPMHVNVQNVYEAAPGQGYQRGVASSLYRTQEGAMA